MPIRKWWRTAHALLFLTALMMQAGAASAQAVDGWTEAQQAKRARQYEALSPADVARQVVVKDDSLEALAVLTTEKVFRFKGNFTDRVRSDAFLRANINKRTGKTTVQLYQELTYTGERRDFMIANFEADDHLATEPLIRIGSDVECPYGVCVHRETVAFTLPETLLRTIAAGSSDRPVRPWRFRLKARVGSDWTDDVAPAEIAGLLIAVDSWRKQNPLP